MSRCVDRVLLRFRLVGGRTLMILVLRVRWCVWVLSVL